MQLRFHPYTLALRHAFGIAGNTRTSTPVMLVEVEHDGIIGYGEASMPPYLGETHTTAAAFLRQVDLTCFGPTAVPQGLVAAIDGVAPGNPAAKAAVDIALHDWLGKRLGQPLHRLWSLDPAKTPVTSFTIGLDIPEVVRQKTLEAAAYKILKVKLGRDTDRMMIETIRSVTDKPITVDANQGWTNRDAALRLCEWLATQGVLFVEQPMPKGQPDDIAWLHDRSPLPLIADESCQRLADIEKIPGVFHGINIKLMKSTGLREARRMIARARELDLKVMLGCMTETSCAISAAAQISPLVDWADLDGADLISNDPFRGATIVDGKVTLTDLPGIGAVKAIATDTAP